MSPAAWISWLPGRTHWVSSAAVFQRMAREVYAREQSLRQQVQELRIQIDEAKKAREVAEITESDYFRSLSDRARHLRGGGRD